MYWRKVTAMKIFQFPVYIIKKLLTPLHILLSKLRVTYQILLVITVMMFFLIIEGLLALNAFNQMKGITQKVFINSVQGFQSISTLKKSLETVRSDYLLFLAGQNHGKLTFSYQENSFLDTWHLKVDPDKKEQIRKLLSDLQTIGEQPLTPDNFVKFDQIYKNLQMNLQLAEENISTNAVSTMEQGNVFFETSRNTNLLLLIISLFISLSIGLPVAAMISRPLQEMVKVAGSLATGNFSQTLKFKGNREINQLVDSLNHAIKSLRTLVINVQEQANDLAKSGKELSNASTDSGRAANDVARAIESMAKAVSEEADQISQTAINVTELGDLVEKVSHDSLKIADSSKQVAIAAQNGQKISTEVASNIGALYTTTKEISQVIEELSQSSEKIKGISLLIEGVAEQTTLLALNAAIEAARAGEHGKGFSVVAKETGKLADQSKQASKEIGALVTEMLTRSNHAVTKIQKGVAEVENGKTLTTAAATTFGNIFKQLEDTLTQINAVASSAQEMARHNEDVINAITSVAAISQEGLATTEEISATVEEQSASAEQVAALAGNLSNIASTMDTSVAAFKI
jgi:methyl-accepting chemotaxis protein